MTEAATRFVTPLTLQSHSQNPVAVAMFESPSSWEIEHISLAKRADLLIIAPVMNMAMYANPIVQMNIAKLKTPNYRFIAPATGCLACGDVGEEKLTPGDGKLNNFLTKKNKFASNVDNINQLY